MSIDATVGGESANSYLDLASAMVYFTAQFGSQVWLSATDADRETALLQAATHLSRLLYIGRPNNPLQAMPFPRAYPHHCDPSDVYRTTVATVPKAILAAQAEEALALLTRHAQGPGDEERSDLQAQGVKEAGIGRLKEVYADSFITKDRFTLTSQKARGLLQGWVLMTASHIASRHDHRVFGGDNRWIDSEFDALGPGPDLGQGLGYDLGPGYGPY